MSTDAYKTLIVVPAGDSNFEYALKEYATSDDLTRAYEYLSNHPNGNKTRLARVKSEIRKRKKEGQF